MLTGLLAMATGSLGCSIPVLQGQECLEARDAVKRFYSYHFDSGMAPTPENLAAKRQYLTDALAARLSSGAGTGARRDFFTDSENYPTAFQISSCEVVSGDRVKIEINLYWRENEQNSQRKITAEMIKRGSDWLLNNVTEN